MRELQVLARPHRPALVHTSTGTATPLVQRRAHTRAPTHTHTHTHSPLSSPLSLLVLLLVIGPTAAVFAFSDAGLSDFEYAYRVVFLPLAALFCLALVTWEQGGLAKDTTPVS